MTIPLTLTRQDIVRMQYYGLWRHTWVIQILVACSLPILLFGLTGKLSGRLLGDPLYNALCLTFAVFQFAYPYLSARKHLRQQQYLQDPMTFEFGVQGMHLEGTGFRADIAWQIVHEIVETRTLFLIYHSRQTAWLLPKRCLTQTQEQEWKELATQHLPGKAKFEKSGVAARIF